MQREGEEEAANTLLETIRRELASMIEEGSEDYERNQTEGNKPSQSCEDETEICSTSVNSAKGDSTRILPKDELFSEHEVLNTSSISNINDSIQKLQHNLDESSKTFRTISENFDKINFGSLTDRIKDLDLIESNSDSIKSIFNDLKQTFDEKYMENHLEELTREVTSKFRDHPGEFADIPEISEFFRTCSRLEHELVKLRQQRDDCMNLQKRMARVAEASYDRVNVIQQRVMEEEEEQQDKI